MQASACTFGAYVTGASGLFSIVPLSSVVSDEVVKTVQTTVNDAEVILRKGKTPLRRVQLGACLETRCRRRGVHQYLDPATKTLSLTIACMECTYALRPCVRRGNSVYDFLVAPLAKEFQLASHPSARYVATGQLNMQLQELFAKSAKSETT